MCVSKQIMYLNLAKGKYLQHKPPLGQLPNWAMCVSKHIIVPSSILLKGNICSTDLHSGNVHGAARNLPWVTAKLLHLGQPFPKYSFFFRKIEFEI